jgi:hypothetical protein
LTVYLSPKQSRRYVLGFPNVRIARPDNDGDGGLMQAIDGKRTCPFHGDDGLCGIHVSGEKPVGCHCAPFYVKNGKLVLRYRYLVLKCHLDWKETGLPAYKAFPQSLITMFGETEAKRITDLLDSGVDKDFEAEMIDEIYVLRAENTKMLARAKAAGGVKRQS